jgi:hypothetical protein
MSTSLDMRSCPRAYEPTSATALTWDENRAQSATSAATDAACFRRAVNLAVMPPSCPTLTMPSISNGQTKSDAYLRTIGVPRARNSATRIGAR